MNLVVLIYLARGKKCISFGNRQAVSHFLPKRGSVPPFVQAETSPPKAGTCPVSPPQVLAADSGDALPICRPRFGITMTFPIPLHLEAVSSCFLLPGIIHYHLFAKFLIKLFSVFSYAVLSSKKEKTLTRTIKLDFQNLLQQTSLWPLHRCG